MAGADQFTEDVLARLGDFLGESVQWQRRLWDISTVGTLRELREASLGMRDSALSGAAIKWLAERTAVRVRNDPGAGNEQQRRAITRAIAGNLSTGGFHDLELELWIDDLERHYLERWKTACAAGRTQREQVARMLTSFLLGEGCSREALRIWVRGIDQDTNLITIVELIEMAEARAAAHSTTFQIVLPFDKPPGRHLNRPSQWRDPAQVSAWLRSAGFPPTRQYGALLLEIDARDGYAAAQAAAEIANRLSARGAVGTRHAFEFAPNVFVQGIPDPILVNPSRRADVRALEREGRLLDVDAAGPIDAALELLSHVNRSPDAVAAAAGWSAVESLLSGPGDSDKVVTADRLASLVACSWPRAELTTIAWARVYQTRGQPDPLATELKAYATNRERAERVLRGIEAGEDLRLEWSAERLAIERMKALIDNPHDELNRVQRRATDTLRRFYRQRNLVVHGGRTAGRTLSLALNAGSPLIGAGLDRITHAALVANIQPLAIAAQAQLELDRAGTPNAPPLTRLLE
ncbi:MAG: hypothetical protein ACLP50_07875 [Solirubrobacteraceae bacterium]